MKETDRSRRMRRMQYCFDIQQQKIVARVASVEHKGLKLDCRMSRVGMEERNSRQFQIQWTSNKKVQ